MLKWMNANRVRWVVKVQQYPFAVQASLDRLESQGSLTPVASAQTEDFANWRITGERAR